MDPNINLDEVLDQVINEELEDNTDEELIRLILQSQQQLHGNTVRSMQRRVVHRNREEGHDRLFNDYFSVNPVYTEIQFRRRFCMRRHVFFRIVDEFSNHDEYFHARFNALGRKGLSLLQKCTAALRILAYGSLVDSMNKYVRIGETTAVEYLKRFVSGICIIFWNEYLRRPSNKDTKRLLQLGATREFPGSNNDITVLNESNVFDEVLSARAPVVQYTVNRTQYNMGYYLTDGFYPDFATFVKTISMPQGEK